MGKMSRPRKAKLNDIIAFRNDFGVVVGYRDNVKWGRYLVVRTDAIGRNPRLAAIWVDSTEIIGVNRTLNVTRPGRNYRGNERLGDRGCSCQCCTHVRGFDRESHQ